MDTELQARIDYWNGYYASHTSDHMPLPSQFASFVAGEVGRGTTLVDVGCGNGRDSFFFATAGMRTIGVDASAAAIQNCNAMRQRFGVTNVDFIESVLEHPGLASRLRDLVGLNGKAAVYARFLLHAITQEQENGLLALAADLTRGGGVFATEFRTVRDASQVKETPEHFRRFLDPLGFLARAQQRGFAAAYFVEGFGFAKHKNDDAFVARFLLKRPG